MKEDRIAGLERQVAELERQVAELKKSKELWYNEYQKALQTIAQRDTKLQTLKNIIDL